MSIATIKALETARAKVRALEEKVAGELFDALAALPGEFGFASMKEFIEALKAASSKGRGAKSAAKSAGKKPRAKRAKITAETKQRVKELVSEGKTGAAIAKELKISIPSVANIKRELGLVKKR